MTREFRVELEIFGKGSIKNGDLYIGENNLNIKGLAKKGFWFRVLIPRTKENNSSIFLIVRGSINESGNLAITIHKKGLDKTTEKITQEFEIGGE